MASSDKTSEQVKLLHLKVKQLLLDGYTDEKIISELKKDGIEPHYAQIIIENVNEDKSDEQSFRNSLIMGFFYIIAGLLLNYFSYQIAVNVNSFFFILFWGVVVLGIMTIIRGFILHKK